MATKAKGQASHAEGWNTVVTGIASHAEGNSTTASGGYGAHAEGNSTKAIANASHAEGSGSESSGDAAHAEGNSTKASGVNSHAEGSGTLAKGSCSHAAGNNTISNDYQFVIGTYNAEKASSGSGDDRFIIGCGWVTRDNAFRVHSNKSVFGGTYNSSGADYAELFEWADGNAEAADRAGLFVTLEGDKIRLATPGDGYLLGIVSASPSVVGDVYDDQWSGMYLQDVFGRTIYEEQDFPEETGPSGEVIREARRELAPKLNPDYDHTVPYLPRTKRPEWDAVGMMGKLVAVDDGTCQADGYATVGAGGVATRSEVSTPYRVMTRLDESHVRILIR